MKRIILASFLIFMVLDLFAQSDTAKSGIKIGLGASTFNSTITILGEAHSIGMVADYKFFNISLAPVFIVNIKKVKEPCVSQYCDPAGPPNVWTQADPYRLGLNGFLVHFRVVPLYQKRFSPVAGINYNYINRIDKGGGTGERMVDYEFIVTGGMQCRFLKNFIILTELGLGRGTGTTHFFGPGGEKGMSSIAKISLSYLFSFSK